MREEDKLMTEQGQVLEKKPYNLRERKIKDAPYRNMIRAELADELYDRIMNIIVLQKKYKDPNYSAKDLAKELKTNTRYLSAVINSRFGMNYSCLVNEYRIKDALHMLIDKRYAEKNVEEISTQWSVLPTVSRFMRLFIRMLAKHLITIEDENWKIIGNG